MASYIARLYATTNSTGGLLGGVTNYGYTNIGWDIGCSSSWSDQCTSAAIAQPMPKLPKLSAKEKLRKEINDWHGNVLEVA